jgi:hypothetical protein
MKHILTFILCLSFFASIGQVRLSDTANNGTFSYHLGSNFRGQYPKGSCYLDRDASGAFAIRRVTGAVVTPYVSMSNYELNGDVDTVFSSYIEKLNGIIMLSCGGSTPIETFAYCGAPIWNIWNISFEGTSDTFTFCTTSGILCEPLRLVYDDGEYGVKLSGAQYNFDNYIFNTCQFAYGAPCVEGQSLNNCLDFVEATCAELSSFNLKANGLAYSSIDSLWYCGFDTNNLSRLRYNVSVTQFDTTDLYLEGFTVGGDSIITQDITIPINDTDSLSVIRTLGIKFLDIDLDTTNATIEITAKPVKTSGQTYATSSFKIEKIAFADITAGSISGSTYNPNLGEQSNTFSLTTGKNTFKVSVEDTDGNIAYSIFQVTKTQL